MAFERGQIAGLVMAILMVGLGASALFGESGLMAWLHRHRDRAKVGEETMRLTQETQALERSIARLANGDGLEVVAREQLGLVRPNEVVYRFHRPPDVATR